MDYHNNVPIPFRSIIYFNLQYDILLIKKLQTERIIIIVHNYGFKIKQLLKKKSLL